MNDKNNTSLYFFLGFFGGTVVFMIVIVIIMIIFTAASMLFAHDTPQDAKPIPVQIIEVREKMDWEIKEELNPFRKTVQGRLGVVHFGTPATQSFDYSRQRLNGGAVFDSKNRFLGLDTMSPTSRIRPSSPDETAAAPPPVQEEPSRYRTAPSSNTIAPAAVGSYRPENVRATRSPNFFDQPGIMNPVPAETQENAPPIEQRWFRDIESLRGGNQLQSIGNLRSGGGNSMSGEAVAVGGMQSEVPLTPAVSGFGNPPVNNTVNFQVSPRNFERQLEEAIQTSPGVHLLSPVQVTYQNGTAIVRGVVANQQNKVEAGKVLLNVQGVKQVNNQLTVVPLDPVRLPIIEPK